MRLELWQRDVLVGRNRDLRQHENFLQTRRSGKYLNSQVVANWMKAEVMREMKEFEFNPIMQLELCKVNPHISERFHCYPV